MYARPARHRDDRGASAVEYGLMVAAIAAVIVGVVFGLGGLVRNAFDKTCSAISSQVQPGCATAPNVIPPGTSTDPGTGADPGAGTGAAPGPVGLPVGS